MKNVTLISDLFLVTCKGFVFLCVFLTSGQFVYFVFLVYYLLFVLCCHLSVVSTSTSRRSSDLLLFLCDFTAPPVLRMFSGTVLLLLHICNGVLVFFTAQCTLVQSAVLRSHVVCLSVRLSVCPSVCPSVCNVCDLGPHRSEISETNCSDN